MSGYLMQSNATVYPNPKEFYPDRWLGAYDPRMDRYLAPFSRGSRRCLGQQLVHVLMLNFCLRPLTRLARLAYSEIHIVLATLFRPNGRVLRLYETDETDVESAHDFLLPLPKLNTKGVCVMVESWVLGKRCWDRRGAAGRIEHAYYSFLHQSS